MTPHPTRCTHFTSVKWDILDAVISYVHDPDVIREMIDLSVDEEDLRSRIDAAREGADRLHRTDLDILENALARSLAAMIT